MRSQCSAIVFWVVATRSQQEAREQVRLLAQKSLHHWGLPSTFVALGNDAGGRPHLTPSPALPHPPDISCSHAPGLTAIALGRGCRVGIDVEPLSTVFPPPMYARLFTPAELAHPLASPVQLWTRKEALLKADGRGLVLDMATLDVLADRVQLDGKIWFLHQINASAHHACHLATDAACTPICLGTSDDACI